MRGGSIDVSQFLAVELIDGTRYACCSFQGRIMAIPSAPRLLSMDIQFDHVGSDLAAWGNAANVFSGARLGGLAVGTTNGTSCVFMLLHPVGWLLQHHECETTG